MWMEIIGNLLSLDTIIGMFVGVIGGIVIGALPGLNATMAVSLLLPITFAMKPYAGFVMLMAIYTSAFYGGSISAILLHTPGTPASAATAMDGYELTLQGRGLEAIGMATVASMFGGALSGVALLTISPLLSKVSLLFSAPEYFLIAIFGLTVIGGLSGGSMIKGFLMGAFGLFLGTIGIDTITGQLRFTYGSDALSMGISLVPAMIGLFSISQVMIQSEDYKNTINRVKKSDVNVNLKGKFLPTFREFVHLLPNMIRSSIIGIFVGILPGAGGDIGAWLSYSEAKKASKNSDLFGKGSLEAICASEAGNNAVTGGSVIPLLTLGIPGSAVASVLLGGFLVHGMVPGNQMFTRMASVTYTIIVGFIIANILMGIVGILIAKHVVKVTKLSTSLLSPLIVVLSTIGAYAINGSIFDVYTMLVFGFIGYLMRKFDLPSAPAILGLLLGPIAENGFMNSIAMAKGNVLMYYLSRPVSLILIAMTVFAIIWPWVSLLIKGKKMLPELIEN
ncbi:tripartite tricarboxylate transporter permease [Acidaminobacter hydrogenoformans]|uniref:Putative tricarboxylic transport membrane protein n=1 Tax=Acidaminobacter hydrogenoformans DSM 2784 TaxID=1120920 RepID=A0A1G5S1V7_9FIRM|nr:tripartite tricarboxylate transporter permease [Acidaminobacter hydrogenoformans]SCZ80354.1 putative tricarboxylic transport membrane protein [Acidaminobacter hydrogenoformans DSM 2784]